MALTKEDLQDIKGVVMEVTTAVVGQAEQRLERKFEQGLGDLALATQQQFLAIDVRFDGVDRRLDRVEARLDQVEETLEGVQEDVGVIKHMVASHEFRIVKLEQRKT